MAYRPPPSLVERVASPPYDVIDSAQARALARGNRDSFLRISRPEIDLPPGSDEHCAAAYLQGKKNLLEFCERGVLKRDAEPQLYLYAQQLGAHRQIGIVACVAVADYLADRIKKHEKTRPDKEDDRTRHITALQAHDEPVFLCYRADAAIAASVGELSRLPTTYDFHNDGVRHQLSVVDAARSRALCRLFADRVPVMYVADGHHRSAAAARAHQQQRGDGREHDVLMAVLFPSDQMNIMAYNRVVRDRLGRSPEQILAAIGERLDDEPAAEPEPRNRGTFSVYTGGGRWHRARVRSGSFDASDPIERLDCQICQKQILEPVFGIVDPRRDESIDFVGGIHGTTELARRVDAAQGSVALCLYPTRMDELMAASDAGQMMPPKSTWFEPKLKSGLFVHMF